MVSCAWFDSEQVTEAGYYWCKYDDDIFIVEVSNLGGSAGAFVWSVGRDYPSDLCETAGLFYGPINPPA